jgi:hypothetical protein
MKLVMVIFIFVANISDALLTDYGIRSQQMAEGNPLMNWLYHQSFAAFFFIKILLPILLLFILFFLLPKKLSRTLSGLLIITCCIYLYVMFLHGVWFLQPLV